MDELQTNWTSTSTTSSLLRQYTSLGNKVAIQLGALLNINHDDEKSPLATAIGMVMSFIFLCYTGFWYMTRPSLTSLPRAGKGPGWFGLGLAEAKRDFKTNGRKILDEGYRKVRIDADSRVCNVQANILSNL